MALDSLHEVMSVFPVFCANMILRLPYFSENIRSITDLVEPEDDCKTITAVHDRIDKESTQRRKELEQTHANLKGLSFSTNPHDITFIDIMMSQHSPVSSMPPARPLRVPPACPPPTAMRKTSTVSTAHDYPSPKR